jgi:excisionase family DNA binding protein
MPQIAEVYRIAMAAKLVGMSDKTLYAAVHEGRIKSTRTACGLPLITLSAAQKFAAHRPKRGPKPKRKITRNP